MNEFAHIVYLCKRRFSFSVRYTRIIEMQTCSVPNAPIDLNPTDAIMVLKPDLNSPEKSILENEFSAFFVTFERN